MDVINSNILVRKQMDKLRVEHDEEIDAHKITDAIEANLGLLVEF